ncbi:DUF308 domain-containing protein [Leucobacter salsicius]|uniref:DUF308 domain-containing protein n=1 Tax=Leucobacter salsicius TaxID=664638 RepID=UPI00035CC343|nr:DUF308 domain-containing protein [Leucobacter salsicius]
MSIQFQPPISPDEPQSAGAGIPRRPSGVWGFVAGGVMIAAGLGLIVWPIFAATWLLGVLVGAALLVNGIGLMTRGGVGLIGGALLGLLGVLAFLMPDAIATAIVTFAGVGFIALGAIWIAFASRFIAAAAARAGGRGLGKVTALLPGALLAAGGVVALIWPDLALAVVAVIGGLCLIALGVFVVWLTRKLRRGGPASQTTIIL